MALEHRFILMPTLAKSHAVDPGIVAGRYGHFTNRLGAGETVKAQFCTV